MSNCRAASNSPPPVKRARLEQREIKCVGDLYLEAKFADVWFSFDSVDGTTTLIPAHKLLLAVVSDVFEAMFFGGLQENGVVEIVDASAGEFKEFLQFFYGKDVELTTEHVAGVMNLGHKYNVEKCVDACAEHLKQNLTDDNVCAALSLATLYDQNELTTMCEQRILMNTGVAFQSAEFLECSKEALAHILQINPLSCSEVDVFEACMAWVRAKSQQNTVSKAMVQKHLGNLYYQIRFVSMTINEFCALESKYNDVLQDDFHTIARLIGQTEKKSEHFNTSPRFHWNKDAIITCDRNNIESMVAWYVYGLDTEERTVFSTSQPLMLGSFKCGWIFFGGNDPRNLISDLSVDVEITEAYTLDGANAKVLSTLKANLQSKNVIVSLPQPVFVRPGFFYTICVKRIPANHSTYSKELNGFLEQGSDFKIKFHKDKLVKEKIVGLISVLNFNKI